MFAEFAAKSIIAEIGDIAFWFAVSGYVGNIIWKDAKRVQEVQFEDNTKNKTRLFGLMQLRSIIFLVLLVMIVSAYAFVAQKQNNGYYFE